MALLSADIEEIAIPNTELPNIVHSLAEVVVDWNVNYTYKNTNLMKKPFEGNCQDFVDAVIQ